MGESQEEAKERAVDSYVKTNAEVAAFRHQGLIDFRATLVEGPSRVHLWWRFEIEPVLTEKGEREAAESSGNKIQKEIAIATRELVEVTGITMAKESTAQVEFTWKQLPTPAGEVFDPNSEAYRSSPEWLRQKIAGPPRGMGRSAEREYGDVRKGRALFQLYDDGWRVRHVQF